MLQSTMIHVELRNRPTLDNPAICIIVRPRERERYIIIMGHCLAKVHSIYPVPDVLDMLIRCSSTMYFVYYLFDTDVFFRLYFVCRPLFSSKTVTKCHSFVVNFAGESTNNALMRACTHTQS